MQLKKLATGVLVVLVLFLTGFTVNNSKAGNDQTIYETSFVKKTNDGHVNIKDSTKARDYLIKKYGDEGWLVTKTNQDKNNDKYWTFVAEKSSQNGMIQAGHTVYVHSDGTINY